MKDDDIIKAYEGLTSNQQLNLFRNFYYNDGFSTEKGIVANAINDILPKYHKQQAEIESLKENRDELWEIHCRDTERYLEHIDEIDTLKKELKTAKSEAIKDFAERVKKELLLLKKECRKALDNDGVFAIKRARKKIDKLVKEMVSENND